jgi:hypothetical protein
MAHVRSCFNILHFLFASLLKSVPNRHIYDIVPLLSCSRRTEICRAEILHQLVHPVTASVATDAKNAISYYFMDRVCKNINFF